MNNNLDFFVLAEEVISKCRDDRYAGHDPFDGLNSSLFALLGAKRFSLARIAWLQLHKRSPLNLRQLAGIPKMRNPKGIALIILGLLERRRCFRNDAELEEATVLGEWLLTACVDRSIWRHHAWGYHFDWAARAFFVPRGKPNAITTCYVARALYALGEATGIARFTQAAIDAGLFLDSLYIRTSGVEYYAYIPGETAFVHNASLWSAALVAKTAEHTDGAQLRARALAVARQTAAMQRADGAWVYGARSHHGFIDGFHTGYNLEALDLLQRTQRTDEFAGVIDKGFTYYRRHFFLPDGTVKYYNDRKWPLDMHSVAQGVVTLLKVGGKVEDLELADAVLSRAHASLYLPDEGRFIYQRGRWVTNRINYMRWTQAWAFYALSLYAAHTSNPSGDTQ